MPTCESRYADRRGSPHCYPSATQTAQSAPRAEALAKRLCAHSGRAGDTATLATGRCSAHDSLIPRSGLHLHAQTRFDARSAAAVGEAAEFFLRRWLYRRLRDASGRTTRRTSNFRHQTGGSGPLRPEPTPRRRAVPDALFLQAFAALNSQAPAPLYDRQRAHGPTRYQGPDTLANRLVGILHGCLKATPLYDEYLAWHTEPDKLSPSA